MRRCDQPWLETIKSNKIIRKDEIGLTPEACRTYPDRESSQIVGYVGLDNTGLSGLEYGLDAYLQKGYTVRTTLDVQLCRIAYQELEKSVREHQAESGSAAIIDLENNEILSLVSFPNGLLAQNQGVSPETLRFPAASMVFEPGSVMKQFSAAYALEKGYNAPNYPAYYCPGEANIKGYTFHCLSPATTSSKAFSETSQ